MTLFTLVLLLLQWSLLLSGKVVVQALKTGGTDVHCSYNPYEELSDGGKSDAVAVWCGQRYSALDVTKLVAIDRMTVDMCNQCIQIFPKGGKGGPAYGWVVDQKGIAGLDLSAGLNQAMWPGTSVITPQVCSWKLVDPCFCTGMCFGSAQECAVGHRNLLPVYQLPPIDPAHPYNVCAASVTKTKTASASRSSSYASFPSSAAVTSSPTRVVSASTLKTSKRSATSTKRTTSTRSSKRRTTSTRKSRKAAPTKSA